MMKLKIRQRPFPELSYANPSQHAVQRWFIRTVEGLSGRDRFAALYDHWRKDIVPTGDRVFSRMLELIDVSVRTPDQWPPRDLPDRPLVILANHPFGIGDGIAILSLAEQLDRPFRVMLASDLLKVPEIEAYSLSVDFSETKEAVKNNLAMRNADDGCIRQLLQQQFIQRFFGGRIECAGRFIQEHHFRPRQ